jgi:dTDP-4-dehydrorhamnose 3,5-epimerase
VTFARLPTRLPDLVHLAPAVHRDERGFFLETYREDELAEFGITQRFVQDNHSRSVRGTIRGLHFQTSPGQGKLVRVARGSILDVAVDIRPESPTFGQHEAVELDDVGCHLLYVPVGFAHGFAVLSNIADVCYKVTSFYRAETEAGVIWNDPQFGIQWLVSAPLVSRRDQSLPSWEEFARALRD